MIRGLRDVIPYQPGIQPQDSKQIKLNANENPYPPSPKVQQALADFDGSQLRYYASVGQPELRKILATHLNVSVDQLIIGGGSDEILSMAFLAFFNNKEPVIFPDLTYGFYKVLADLYSISYKEIPLTKDFKIGTEDYICMNGGIVLVNPNAPTGYYKPLDEVEKIVQANQDVVVIIDEAYINFSQKSAVELLNKYPNVFIVRTFSKDASLAGLRVGYGVGSKELIGVINAVKDSVNPYNVDSIAEKLAIAAIEDWGYYKKTIEAICHTRDWFTTALEELGCQVLKSEASFVLMKPIHISAPDLLIELEKVHIYVRHYPKADRIKEYLRISIGTDQEMTTVLESLKNIMTKNTKE